MNDQGRRVYADMGVIPVINTIGNQTLLGGSTCSPRVQEAMQAASRYYVDMDELLQSTGQIVAGLLECEAALVTAGCAAALLLGTAACLTGKDPEKMARLPDATGMKREVVIQKTQRYKYDRMIRMAGACFVEAGTPSGTTPAQLETAIGPNTLALLYPVHAERPGLVSVREAIQIAHRRGIPIFVDAAGRVYPLDELKKYAAWGADLVGYGAKYFGAPNSTGLLCGRRELVEAARLHSFASFEKNTLAGIGRPLKLDRQEVVAVVVALREWLEMDHQARFAAMDRRGRNLRQALSGLPHTRLSPDGKEAQVTTLSVQLDEKALGKTTAQVVEELRAGNPSIWVGVAGSTLALSMHTVMDGDEHVIAERLRGILRG